MAGPSQSSILELRAIAAEHADQFSREGKSAKRGSHQKNVKTKDPFDKPSPGLVKRLAAEARNDAKRRRFNDDGDGPSEEQRFAIMQEKAKKYDALRRGDYSKFTEKELAEAVIDYERKFEEDSESDSDNSLSEVEYVDELGRTRKGSRLAAAAATSAKHRSQTEEENQSSYADVMQSKVIKGDQSFFPVYEPDSDVLRQKYLEAEKQDRQQHYDSTKDVRIRGAGQYQFSLDEAKRAEQMASLKAAREETERARARVDDILRERNERLEQRQALLEAARIRMAGGEEALAKMRAEARAKEADELLNSITG